MGSSSLLRRSPGSLLLALLAGVLGCHGSVVQDDSSSSSGGGGGTGGTGGTTITDPAPACPEGPWGRSFPDSYSYEYGQSISVDASCQVLVAGAFGGELDLGGATLQGKDEDLFLAKLDAEGHHLWSKSFGIEPFQGAAVAAMTPSGDVVLGGLFHGSIDFGVGAFNAPKQGVFAAGFTPDGKPRWAHAYNGTAVAAARALVVDSTSAATMCGSFEGFLDLGTGQLGVPGEDSAFVMRLSPEGDTLWSLAWNGVDPVARTLAVDEQGYAVVGGQFYGSMDLGATKLFGGEMVAAFVVRLDPQGEVVYARALDGSGPISVDSVAIDSQGNALIAGTFSQTLDLGDGPHFAEGGSNVFVASLDPAGQTLWSRAFGGHLVGFNQIATDRAGRVWIGGAFGGDLALDGFALTSDGTTDGLLVSADETGKILSATRFGGPLGGADGAASVVVDPGGGAMVTGTFQGTADLGSGPVTSKGGFDVFVARFVQP